MSIWTYIGLSIGCFTGTSIGLWLWGKPILPPIVLGLKSRVDVVRSSSIYKIARYFFLMFLGMLVSCLLVVSGMIQHRLSIWSDRIAKTGDSYSDKEATLLLIDGYRFVEVDSRLIPVDPEPAFYKSITFGNNVTNLKPKMIEERQYKEVWHG